jgi:tripartite-type tricarboxylate transporter receptor subunit TctC
MPTIAEQGVPGYDAVLRYALVAPAGTPRPIIDKLNKALNAAIATDEVKKRLALEGAEPVTARPINTQPTSTRRSRCGPRW